MEPPDLLGDAGGVAPRLVVRDEAVAWPRERVGEHVERARLAAGLDAVAALWLRREGCRLAGLDGDGSDQPVELPQHHIGRIRDAADVDLDRVTGREGRLCRQDFDAANKRRRGFRLEDPGHCGATASMIRYIACDQSSGVATGPQRLCHGSIICRLLRECRHLLGQVAVRPRLRADPGA